MTMAATAEYFATLGMNELTAGNDLLNDPNALKKFWDEEGYLYLKDVLDRSDLTKARAVITDALADRGLAELNGDEVVWTGEPTEALPRYPDEIYTRQPANEFVSTPAVHDLFGKILGDEPFWIPISTYRFTPPSQKANEQLHVHQDGYFNQGIPFRICWIPLVDIGDELGGIALAPRYHTHGALHDASKPPRFPIPDDAIPAGEWRRATYEMGDLLIMDRLTPHVGLSNHTRDRWRLSMDIRVIPASDPARPLVGQISAVSPDSITVIGDEGKTVSLGIDPDTYLRGRRGDRIPLEEMTGTYHVGDQAMIAHTDGKARVIRPVVY
jgi:Phytanoyl-CoA dioxygenase (PhyH)